MGDNYLYLERGAALSTRLGKAYFDRDGVMRVEKGLKGLNSRKITQAGHDISTVQTGSCEVLSTVTERGFPLTAGPQLTGP